MAQMNQIKPLEGKAYGHIGHLEGSRLGPGDHHVEAGQTRMCLSKWKEKGDTVIVEEKYDGSCMAVAKVDGHILPLGRAGYHASTSPYEQHRMFAAWVYERHALFDDLLREGEMSVGEWLAQAHGVLYKIGNDEQVFVIFDLMVGTVRAPHFEVNERTAVLADSLCRPEILHQGGPLSLEVAIPRLNESPQTEFRPIALGQPEGMVYRVERKGETVVIAKWVRPDKVDGSFLPEISGGAEVWNWRPGGEGTWRTNGIDLGPPYEVNRNVPN